MARYFGQNLQPGDPPTPSTEALIGLQPMERHRAEAAMRAQDKVVQQCARVLWRTGLNGDDSWLVLNTAPGATQTHPESATPRKIVIGRFDITPGCTLRATCLCLPSGQTSSFSTGNWLAGGVQGVIQFAADWEASDATTETYVYVMALPGSQLENGSEDTGSAGLQSSQRLAQIKMAPPVDLSDLSERQRWSRPHSVEIEIRYVGSPRVIDLTIWEVPNYWIAEADQDDDEWTQHVFAIGKPDDEGVRTKWPVDEREDTGAGDRDQRIGTLQCLRVAENQRKRFGPALFYWGAYMENAGAVTDTALPFITIGTAGSATWVNALNTSQGSTASSPAAFDPSEPGWSMGCAGYARSWLHNNTQVLPNTPYATVPVLVRVYCQNNDNTAVSARFHTAPDTATTDAEKFSWIDMTIPASMGAAAWVEAWGYLQVGVNPEQHVVGQLMVLQQTAGVGMDLDIYAVQAYVWDGTYAPI